MCNIVKSISLIWGRLSGCGSRGYAGPTAAPSKALVVGTGPAQPVRQATGWKQAGIPVVALRQDSFSENLRFCSSGLELIRRGPPTAWRWMACSAQDVPTVHVHHIHRACLPATPGPESARTATLTHRHPLTAGGPASAGALPGAPSACHPRLRLLGLGKMGRRAVPVGAGRWPPQAPASPCWPRAHAAGVGSGPDSGPGPWVPEPVGGPILLSTIRPCGEGGSQPRHQIPPQLAAVATTKPWLWVTPAKRANFRTNGGVPAANGVGVLTLKGNRTERPFWVKRRREGKGLPGFRAPCAPGRRCREASPRGQTWAEDEDCFSCSPWWAPPPARLSTRNVLECSMVLHFQGGTWCCRRLLSRCLSAWGQLSLRAGPQKGTRDSRTWGWGAGSGGGLLPSSDCGEPLPVVRCKWSDGSRSPAGLSPSPHCQGSTSPGTLPPAARLGGCPQPNERALSASGLLPPCRPA